MSFPTSPVDGQVYKEFKYDTTLGAWDKSNDLIVDTIRGISHPSFSGRNLATHTTYNNSKYIPAEILHNIGNHYSGGVFTVPIKGKYLVTWSALVYTNYVVTGHAYVYFTVNNVEITQLVHSRHGFARKYESLSMTSSVDCQVGDQIKCKLFTGTGTTIYAGFNSMGICLIG